MTQRTLRALLPSLALFVLGASLPALAASPAATGLVADRVQRIDQFIDRTIKAGEISGAVTLVARNGKVVHLQAQGLADIASRKPMQKDTVFRIASMSKPVTAVAILMLVEEGKVRLDDPLSRFIPAFRDVKVAVAQPRAPGPGAAAAPSYYTVPADRQVTVLDILTHTSGIASGPIGNAAAKDLLDNRRKGGTAWAEQLATAPLEFQPGTRWAYSPFGAFDVLGRIVEIASGQRYADFLQQRLFTPLRMTDASFWPSEALRARVVTNYVMTPRGIEPNADADQFSSAILDSGAAGLFATAESYARFAMMLANGGELDGVRVLSPASVALMGSRIIPDTLPGRQPGEGWGLGVRSVTDSALRHTLLSTGSFGWSGAYGTHFWIDPKQKLVAIMMVQTPGQSRTGDFETAVMQAVLP